MKKTAAVIQSQPPWWEKHGNTSWVSCRKCEKWFHVSLALLQAKHKELHCPHCGDRFKQEEAGEIVRP